MLIKYKLFNHCQYQYAQCQVYLKNDKNTISVHLNHIHRRSNFPSPFKRIPFLQKSAPPLSLPSSNFRAHRERNYSSRGSRLA